MVAWFSVVRITDNTVCVILSEIMLSLHSKYKAPLFFWWSFTVNLIRWLCTVIEKYPPPQPLCVQLKPCANRTNCNVYETLHFVSFPLLTNYCVDWKKDSLLLSRTAIDKRRNIVLYSIYCVFFAVRWIILLNKRSWTEWLWRLKERVWRGMQECLYLWAISRELVCEVFEKCSFYLEFSVWIFILSNF